MAESKKALITSIKVAVSKHGLAGISTRNIADAAGVNSGLIYRYFEDKDDLLLQAYGYESNIIFGSIMNDIDGVHGIPFSFRDKARLSFHRIWKELLSDSDRLRFCTTYYYSSYFHDAKEIHNEQSIELINEIKKYFISEELCELTAYSLLNIMYDAAVRVVDGRAVNSAEFEENLFKIFYGALLAHVKDEYKSK